MDKSTHNEAACAISSSAHPEPGGFWTLSIPDLTVGGLPADKQEVARLHHLHQQPAALKIRHRWLADRDTATKAE